MTKYDWEILESIAGLRTRPKWGAWVAACVDYLQDKGFISRRTGEITEAGKKALVKRTESSTPREKRYDL